MFVLLACTACGKPAPVAFDDPDQMAFFAGPRDGMWMKVRRTNMSIPKNYEVQLHQPYGKGGAGPAGSDCWIVAAGTLHGNQIVSTTDLHPDFNMTVTTDMVRKHGVFVDLRGANAQVRDREGKSACGTSFDGKYRRVPEEEIRPNTRFSLPIMGGMP
jgi:hypothetical protein